MKPYIFLYCEGNDSKAVLATKEKDGMKIHRFLSSSEVATADSIVGNVTDTPQTDGGDFNLDELSDDFSFDDSGSDYSQPDVEEPSVDVSSFATQLSDIKLNQAEFIPVVTEPNINYHTFESGNQGDNKKLKNEAKKDIFETKGMHIQDDLIDCVELNESSVISAYLESDIQCVNFIYNLAQYNGRRFYRIPAIKSADLSLVHYVAKSTKFFPEDNSLIIYIGKDYSKLIFLEGEKLKHIGSTLDIGTNNLHTYDVYFSKILLEMENGGIPRLDNIFICGEDHSENLILSFYGTFPEANVEELSFENIETENITEEQRAEISNYSIPIAAAVEYFDELDKKHKGIQILPKYIVEEQKFWQFGWHSTLILILMGILAGFGTVKILENFQTEAQLTHDITNLEIQKAKSEDTLAVYNQLLERVSSFDVSKELLDSATVGSEFWSKNLDDIASFVERRRNFWINSIEVVEDSIQIKGYSVSRRVLTEFSDKNEPSVLRNMFYEPLREKNTFKYLINIILSERIKKMQNEDKKLLRYGP